MQSRWITGVKHLENCPIQPKIPIYMLVGGCFGLLKVLSLLWRQVRLRRYRDTGDVDADVDDVYNDDDDDDDEGGGAIMSKSSRYTPSDIRSLPAYIMTDAGHEDIAHSWANRNSSELRRYTIAKWHYRKAIYTLQTPTFRVFSLMQLTSLSLFLFLILSPSPPFSTPLPCHEAVP